MIQDLRPSFHHNSTVECRKQGKLFHRFITSPYRARFAAGIQGTHNHKFIIGLPESLIEQLGMDML